MEVIARERLTTHGAFPQVNCHTMVSRSTHNAFAHLLDTGTYKNPDYPTKEFQETP